MKYGVLLVGNFLSASGFNRGVCEDLAERLEQAGWPVITTSRRPARLPRLVDMMATAWRRRREYAVAQVDVYSGRSFLWAEAVCWTLRRADKPYVLTLHGGALPDFARRWPGRVRRLLKPAAAVTTPSFYLRGAFSPIRPDMRYIPNGLSISSYTFRLRRECQPVLIWLRAFHHIYQPGMAVEVLAALRREFPEIRLVMIGPDKGDGSWQSVQRLAGELGVADALQLMGPVPKVDVPQCLEQGDIFINTSRFDSFGVSVMEAAACGLPVVTTAVGELPYLWQDGESALLVPPDDPEAMAAAVRRVLREPGLAERLSRNARKKAEGFDWSAVLPQWERLLLEVASRDRIIV